MITDFQQGLLITAIGMGLVFVVIILLWGLMALLMQLTSRERSKKVEETSAVEDAAVVLPAVEMDEPRLKAIAAAVAAAIMLEKTKMQPGSDRAGYVKGNLSPWQAVHRSRQMGNRR
jgi:sodium pump decarboxylase gamma subunit